MIQILFNGVDIYPKVMLEDCSLMANYGDQLDSITLHFNDADEVWTSYNPSINDKVEVKIDNFTTGVMLVDLVRSFDSVMTIKALPIFISAKTATRYNCVENISLSAIVGDIASKYGMQLKLLCNASSSYQRVEQINKSDLAFAKKRCEIEGLKLKLFDKSFIVYNLTAMRNATPVKNMKKENMENLYFDVANVYDCCSLSYNDVTVTAGGGNNPLFLSDIAFYSSGEGNRFAQNLLSNQFKYIGTFEKQLDTDLTAGNVIAVSDLGMFDGNYLILESNHNPVLSKTKVTVGL